MRSFAVSLVLGIVASACAWGATEFNPDYFAHPAYVMQSVSDRSQIFAMPLDGVPELGTHVLRDHASTSDATWSAASSDPSLIGTAIESNVLYIWGADSASTGTGSVILTAVENGGNATIEIPVVVFQQDKTLLNAEGVKDYFVPWSPQLDINRIKSVEEHMEVYGKDEGALDRSYQWSRWKRMEDPRSVVISADWGNVEASQGQWDWNTQQNLVDVLLRELRQLGVGTVRIIDSFYVNSLSGTDIVPVYDVWNIGPSRRPYELKYLVDEAHRNGIAVSMTNIVGVNSGAMGGGHYEIWQVIPESIDEYWRSYFDLTLESLQTWSELGVDTASIGYSMEYVDEQTHENGARTNQKLAELARAARQYYHGPIAYLAGLINHLSPGTEITEASFWESVDIIGAGVWYHKPLAETDAPQLDELVSGWRATIQDVLQPFQERFDKPYVPTENSAFSIAGLARWSWSANMHLPESEVVVDIEQMRLYYKSFIEAFSTMDGYFGPAWEWYSLRPYSFNGGIVDATSNPRGKVDDILEHHFTGDVTPRATSIDGDLSEWSTIPMCGGYGSGATGNSDFIRWANGAQDDQQLFLAIEFAEELTGGFRARIDIDGDLAWDYQINCYHWTNDFYGIPQSPVRWTGSLHPRSSWRVMIGRADLAVVGTTAELAIYKDFIPEPIGEIHLRVLSYAHELTQETDSTTWIAVCEL